ncbi:exported hypothetical protein [uncultured Eubacteriales bacterium]|uniref:Uncharacterized protein n=1 Tax=uncultured Eubacteriales bacterium TaxID=172733 RepID=A0A212JIB7_9FIRM|nr:exported hypothetical protein [uncultured Eubacteriales bacterium]
MRVKRITAILMLLVALLVTVTGCSDELPSGLPDVYEIAKINVENNLVSPSSAVFPEFDDSFVEYSRSILEDVGKGTLEYRVYEVNAYVDSENTFGAMVRTHFFVEVYAYVDDYNSPKFGEEGIHKNIEDHYYTIILSLNG